MSSGATAPPAAAAPLLDALLGYLGFSCEIVEELGEHGADPGLQVITGDAALLTGKGGTRLNDIQYLLNRLLQEKEAGAPRVSVDIGHFRAMREDAFLADVHQQAESVRLSGRPARLAPMNAYFRRLVHQAFKDDPTIQSWSPPGPSRVKPITLKKKATQA